MKLTNSIALSSIALSSAHLAMVEPNWNYGTADTTMCDGVYKEIAGTAINPEDAKTCEWKQHRDAHWFNTGTQNGCPAVTGQVCGNSNKDFAAPCCEQPTEPTLTDPKLLSFTKDANSTPSEYAEKIFGSANARFNPWFAPGHAPVLDACGIVGGYKWNAPALYAGGPKAFGSQEPAPEGVAINGSPAPEGMQFPAGTSGSALFHNALTGSAAPTDDQPVTTWVAGGKAEVAQGGWYANHGGGYQWRLCPASKFTADGAKNEECFQSMPLDYASDKSQIQFGSNASSRVDFDAIRVTDANTEGVLPKGSTWTKLPVPNCGPGKKNLVCNQPSYIHGQPLALNFPAPAKGVYGFGAALDDVEVITESAPEDVLNELRQVKQHYDFTVVDKVKVPNRKGRYVLSWRWDSEQTPQVWNNCALIDIVPPAQTKRALRGRQSAESH